MENPMIINIQKYSVHDGDGIRTTLFFKGCMLSCAWCHNPESQIYESQLLFRGETCVGCGGCRKNCPEDAIQINPQRAITNQDRCLLCGTCVDYCPHHNREIIGKEYSVEDLLRVVDQDACFYEESGGGVTLSGGEVMTQNMEFIERLCKGLNARGYHIAVDTCGFAPRENFARLLSYVDLFLYDIKMINNEDHKRYVGQSNEQILSNLAFLVEHHANINIRIPVIEPVNSHESAMSEIAHYIKTQVGFVNINLLPYHSIGSSKYEQLGREYPGRAFQTPTMERMEVLKLLFEEQGFNHVKIGG